jgi:putative hydrolase of the HAD superfamily
MKDPVKLIKSLSHPLKPLPTGISAQIPEGPHPRAVIFDIYGTLFISAAGDIGKDSAQHSAEAFSKALADSGIPAVPDAEQAVRAGEIFREQILEWHKRLKSLGVDFPEVDICEIWERVLDSLGIMKKYGSVSHEQIMLLAVSYECRTNPVWPMPGAARLLESLKRKGIKTGIISNAQFYTPLMFEALLGKSVEEYGFQQDLCTWSWRVGVAKPSLEMFRPVNNVIQDRYGIRSESVMYVGNDMLKDILPAQQTGWKTALFAGDRRSPRMREDDPRVKETRPWCTITALDQLSVLM